MNNLYQLLICPISLDLLLDPVIASDGITYNRKSIEIHFMTSDTSPVTREKMTKKLQKNRIILQTVLYIIENTNYFDEHITSLSVDQILQYDQHSILSSSGKIRKLLGPTLNASLLEICIKKENNTEIKYSHYSRDDDIYTIYNLLNFSNIDVNLVTPIGSTLLHIACKNNWLKIVEKLLTFPNINVNVVTTKEHPLEIACKNGHREIVEKLLTFPNIVINDFGGNILNVACKNNWYDVVKKLIEMPNININCVSNYDGSSLSPLLIACQNKYESIAILLLTHPDININCLDENKNTPLSIACENGMTDVVFKLLEKQNINVDNVNAYGDTPLLLACENKFEKIALKILTFPDIKINITNKQKDTPLLLACKNKLELTIIKLIKLGCNIHHTNKLGKSFFQIACNKPLHKVIYEILDSNIMSLISEQDKIILLKFIRSSSDFKKKKIYIEKINALPIQLIQRQNHL